MTKEHLIVTLAECLEEKPLTKAKRVYYMAGTLCVDQKEEDAECILLNFKDSTLGKPLRLLMGKLYLKHKTPNHAFYTDAKAIVDEASK